MTQEEKELVLKDLCARLIYGVIIYVEHDWFEDEVPPYDALLTVEYQSILNNFSKNPLTCCLIIKPYLRPMTSMTEKEKEEYCNLQDKFLCSSRYSVTDAYELFDWLNKNHFDYRGLIPMGLAIEVTKDNNPYKN